MKIKNLWRLYPVVIFVGIIAFFETKAYLERQKFYKTAINSLIIKKKNNFSGGRSYDYVTKNNVVITLLFDKPLKVGDSISKKANTTQFKVYRKNEEGKYDYYNSYD